MLEIFIFSLKVSQSTFVEYETQRAVNTSNGIKIPIITHANTSNGIKITTFLFVLFCFLKKLWDDVILIQCSFNSNNNIIFKKKIPKFHIFTKMLYGNSLSILGTS